MIASCRPKTASNLTLSNMSQPTNRSGSLIRSSPAVLCRAEYLRTSRKGVKICSKTIGLPGVIKILHMNLRTTPDRNSPFLVHTCRKESPRLAKTFKPHSRFSSATSNQICGASKAPGPPKADSVQHPLSSDSLRLAFGIAGGLTASSQPAKADISDVIQAGSNLVQKDTIIAIAFGTAILALGAVTVGVRVKC